MLKSRLFFKKIANLTGKLLQNYKYLQCEVFRVLLKHVNDHLSLNFQFALLYLQKWKKCAEITDCMRHRHIQSPVKYLR